MKRFVMLWTFVFGLLWQLGPLRAAAQVQAQKQLPALEKPVPITLPWFGKADLRGNVDVMENRWFLETTLRQVLNAGPLRVDTWTIGLSNTRGLSVTARTKMFGRSATIGLRELKGKRKATFVITFDQPPTIKITPDKQISLSELALTLETGKPPILTSDVVVFGQRAILSFGVKKSQQLASITLPEVKLRQLAPEITNPDADKIKLRDVRLQVENFFTNEATGPLKVTLAGRVDLTGLNIKGLEVDLSDLAMSGTIDKQEGVELVSSLKELKLPVVGEVQNGALTLRMRPKKEGTATTERFDIVLSGSTRAKIPGIGVVAMTLSSTYEQGQFALRAQLDEDFTFKDVTIRNPMVEFGTAGFEISGDATVLKLDVHAKLNIVEGEEVKFEGEVKHKKPYKPFAKSGIPKIKDIALHNTKVILETSATGGHSFAISGTTTVLDQELDAMVRVQRTPDGKAGLVLRGALPKGWKPMPKVTLKKPIAIVSTVEYRDEELDLKVRKGVGFSGTLELTGLLHNVPKITGTVDTALQAYGSIGASLKDMIIRARIPTKINFPNKRISATSQQLEVTGEPTVGIICDLTVQPTNQDTPLVFAARINIEAYQVAISGTMEGFWDNPAGLKGLRIGDLALGIGFSYVEGIPSEFGLTGKLHIGTKRAELAINVAVDPRNIIFAGRMPDLSIHDIIDLANKMGVKLKKTKIPPIGFENVALKIAPFGGQIGEIRIDRGITLSSETTTIFNQKGIVDIGMDYSGIIMKGYMSKIDFGPLKITGAGPDHKWNTQDDGPIVDFALTLMQQHMFYSGLFSFLGVKKEGELNLSKDGFWFKMVTSLFGLQSSIYAKSAGTFEEPDFIYEVELKDDFAAKIGPIVSGKIDEWANSATQNLEKAKQDLSKYDARTQEIDKQIAVKLEQIFELQSSLHGETVAARQRLGAAREMVQEQEQKSRAKNIATATNQRREIQKRITQVDAQVADSKAWYAGLGRAKKALNAPPYAAKLAMLEARKAALVAAYAATVGIKLAKDAALAALKGMQGALKALEKVAFDPSSTKDGIKLSAVAVEAAALEAEKVVVLGKKVATQAALTAAQKGVQAGATVGKAVAGRKIFHLKKAGYRISLNDLVHGKLPEISFEVVALGKDLKIKLAFDLKKVAHSAGELAGAIIRKLQGAKA